MKVLIGCVFLGVFLNTFAEDKVIKASLTKVESLREKLMRTGKLEAYFNATKIRRAQNKILGLSSLACTNCRDDLRDYMDSSYVATVQLGTPSKAFDVIMDTGSADFWVPSLNCPSQGCSGKHRYSSSQSTSYSPSGYTFNIQYGTGSCSGTEGTETLSVSDIKVTTQYFGMANTMADFFAGQNFDGILGLGYQRLNSNNLPPPHITMFNQGQISKKQFSVYMAKNGPTLGNIGGEITFGGVDYTKIKGGVNSSNPASLIHWVDVSVQGYWQFKIDSMRFGSHSIDLYGNAAISDTGTSLIVGPASAIAQIASHTSARFSSVNQLYQFSKCSDTHNLPDLYININGRDLVVQRRSYIIQYPAVGGGNICFLAMQGGDAGSVNWILGDTFIREWVNIYDWGNNRVGFGRSVDGCSNVKSSAILFSFLMALAFLFR